MTNSRTWTSHEVTDTCRRLRRQTASAGAQLTGFPFRLCQPIKGYRLRGVQLDATDWREAWVEASEFVECTFNRADFSGLRDHGNRFEECEFNKTQFNGAVLGFEGSRYIKCTFDRADFTHTGFIRAVFEDCSFRNCRLSGIDFEASRFVRTRFEGRLKDVWFRGDYGVPYGTGKWGIPEGDPVLDADFEQATLDGVTYGMGLDLSRVRLPDEPGSYLYDQWGDRLARVERALADADERTRRETRVFSAAYAPRGDQRWYIITMSDLDRDFGHDLASRFVELLGEPTRKSG